MMSLTQDDGVQSSDKHTELASISGLMYDERDVMFSKAPKYSCCILVSAVSCQAGDIMVHRGEVRKLSSVY
jgi:hypothetical protein